MKKRNSVMAGFNSNHPTAGLACVLLILSLASCARVVNDTSRAVAGEGLGNESVTYDASYEVHVWEDHNDDGVEDPNEQPMGGVVIQFVDPATGWFWQRDATDANGNLSAFSAGGNCGDYMIILVVPDGYWPTTGVTSVTCTASFGLRPYPQGSQLLGNHRATLTPFEEDPATLPADQTQTPLPSIPQSTGSGRTFTFPTEIWSEIPDLESSCEGTTLEAEQCVSELAYESARELDQLLQELDLYFPVGAWEQAFWKILIPQEEWEAAKQIYCTFDVQNWLGGSGHGIAFLNCILEQNRDRIGTLERIVCAGTAGLPRCPVGKPGGEPPVLTAILEPIPDLTSTPDN